MSSAKNKLKIKNVYEEGSEACRNYSRLTMRVRTLAHSFFIIAFVGLATMHETKFGDELSNQLSLFVGYFLLTLSISLWLIDWHYQSAFTSIRDSLADLESSAGIYGPWRAHLEVRKHFYDHLASYVPFLLLTTLSLLSVTFSIPQEHKLIPQGLGILVLICFFFACYVVSRKHNKIYNIINKKDPRDKYGQAILT